MPRAGDPSASLVPAGVAPPRGASLLDNQFGNPLPNENQFFAADPDKMKAGTGPIPLDHTPAPAGPITKFSKGKKYYLAKIRHPRTARWACLRRPCSPRLWQHFSPGPF